VLETVQKISWKFLWNGKKAKVNVETAKLHSDFGGIGYPDFKDTVAKAHAKWMTRLLAAWEDPAPWITLAKWSIAHVNQRWGHGLSAIYTPGSEAPFN